MNGTRGASDRVKGPGIALMIVGILGVLFGLLGILIGLLGFGLGAAQFDELRQRGQEVPEWVIQMFSGGAGAIQIVLNLIGIACSAFVAYAGLQMQKLSSRTLCMVGSVVAMVPCLSPCCCIGLPIGIWALVVLSKDDVNQAFK
jgi:hypothetical protein